MKVAPIFRVGLLSVLLLGPLSASAADSAHKYLTTDPAPGQPQLPYSDAVQAGDTLYVAGTLGLDATTAQAPADAGTEARLVLDAVKHTLERAGYTFDDAVSVTVYCTNLELYGLFNDTYKTYFHGHYPARAFIGVNQLVRGAHFEVMVTAVKSTARVSHSKH